MKNRDTIQQSVDKDNAKRLRSRGRSRRLHLEQLEDRRLLAILLEYTDNGGTYDLDLSENASVEIDTVQVTSVDIQTIRVDLLDPGVTFAPGSTSGTHVNLQYYEDDGSPTDDPTLAQYVNITVNGAKPIKTFSIDTGGEDDTIDLGLNNSFIGVSSGQLTVTGGVNTVPSGDFLNITGVTLNATATLLVDSSVEAVNAEGTLNAGTITVNAPVSLSGDMAIRGVTATFSGAVTGNFDLDIRNATTNFSSAVGGGDGTTAIGSGGVGNPSITFRADTTATFASTLRTTTGMTQIDGGTGRITFQGNVDILAAQTSTTLNGRVTLDGLTFTSAGDVAFGSSTDDTLTLANGTVAITTTAAGTNVTINATTDNAGTGGAQAFQISAGTGTINVVGAIGNTTSPLSTDLAAATVRLHDVATTGTQLYTAGTLIQTNSAYVSSGAPITFAGPTVLNSNTTVDTTNAGGTPGGAKIDFQGTLDSTAGQAYTLGLTAGTTDDIDFDAAVGSGLNQELGAITIFSGATVTASSTIEAASLVQSGGTGTTTLYGQVTTTAVGTNVSLNTGTVDVNANVVTNGGNVNLDATTLVDLDAAATITTTSSAAGGAGGAVDIDTSGTGTVNLAGAIDARGAANPGGSGGAGGQVTIDTNDGTISVTNITTSGGNSTGGGGNGGNAANIAITVGDQGNNAAHALTLNGALIARGGTPSGGGAAGTGSIVELTADGQIVDADDTATDIQARGAELIAGTGIAGGAGDGWQLEIDVEFAASGTNLGLAATTASGDIIVRDVAGGLLITDVNGIVGAGTSGVSITAGAAGDDIDITAASPLTISSDVTNTGGGNIAQAAEGSADADDLTIAANITASGGSGNISLLAGDDIVISNAATDYVVSATGSGQVVLAAGTNYNNFSVTSNLLNGNALGDLTMADGSEVRTQDGNIGLLATGSIAVSIVDADYDDDVTLGNILAVADYAGVDGGIADGAGAITDALGTESNNLNGVSAILRAEAGIGGDAADLDASLTMLAGATDTGDITLTNDRSLTVGSVSITLTGVFAGIVNINAVPAANGIFALAGLTIEDSAGDNSGGDNITITARRTSGGPLIGPSLTVSNAILDADGGDVSLTADGPTNTMTADVVLNAGVTIAGTVAGGQAAQGDVTIWADHDVTGDNSGDIATTDGDVTLIANADDSSLGSNDDGTIRLGGNISTDVVPVDRGTVTFSLEDCDGQVGATPGGADGRVTAGYIVMGIDARAPEGVLRLQAGSTTGGSENEARRTTVVEGTLIVNGVLIADEERDGVVVEDGGVLGGDGDGADPPLPFAAATTGVIDSLEVNILRGGILDPGDCLPSDCAPQPGVLWIEGNVMLEEPDPADTPPITPDEPGARGELRVQLRGLTPGSGYDQLVLNGTGNLNGAVVDGSDGGRLTVQPQFSIPIGAEFYVVSKIPEPDWDTRFVGLPEGAFLSAGSTLMNISYFASDTERSDTDDNDIVLTAPGRYDFNGYGGHTETNYMAVSPFQAKDSGNTAGWVTTSPYYLPWYFERYTPTAPDWNRLRYDGQATHTSGDPLLFSVDVVAGKAYEVMILTGDAYWNHDREQFQVYDGSGTPPDEEPSLTASLDSDTQVVNVWGVGAPDGTTNLVTWGGGTANTAPGYYRWIRFTTDVITKIGMTDLGSLLMKMLDRGGGDGSAVILAMDIRPLNAVGELTIVREDPADTQPFSGLEADGVTADWYSGTGAPPNAWVTVTVSANVATGWPSNYTAVNPAGVDGVLDPDGDLAAFGGQVQADEYGDFRFWVQRPAKLYNPSGSPATENWTITVEESSGLSRGQATQPYTEPATAAFALRFDFGTSGSPLQTYGEPAKSFLQVIPQTIYNATRGYGWVASRVAGSDRQDNYTTIPYGAGTHDTASNLRRDFNSGSNANFRVDLPNGTYNIRLYHSKPLY